MKNIIRITAIIVVSILAFAIHVKYGNYVADIISKSMAGVEIAKPPYSFVITSVAAISSILPTLGIFILFALAYDKIPGRSPLIKGIFFGLLRLLSEGELIRMPLMNVLVGNPLWVAAIGQSEVYAINIIISVLFSYSIHICKTSYPAK